MPRTTEFIRALEQHRAQRLVRPYSDDAVPSTAVLLSWIHHDNMLEGRMFKPAEIARALDGDDSTLDRYLHPLMKEIRRYRDAILYVWRRAQNGRKGVSIDALKAIHRRITPNSKDRGGLYRRTSPVHRDYFQDICAADKIPYTLKRVFDTISSEFDTACDPMSAAANVHHQLMHAYPFRRNPGTAARLFTNLLLLSRGYPPLIIPCHRRDAYYHALNHPEHHRLAEIFKESMARILETNGGHLNVIHTPRAKAS